MTEGQIFHDSHGTNIPSLAGTMANSTSYLRLPTPKDLFEFPVRFARGARRFATKMLPTEFGELNNSLRHSAADIAAAEVPDISQAAVRNNVGHIVEGVGRHPETIWEAWRIAVNDVFGWNNVRSFGGMLNYMTSRWAFGAFILVSEVESIGFAVKQSLISTVSDSQSSGCLRWF